MESKNPIYIKKENNQNRYIKEKESVRQYQIQTGEEQLQIVRERQQLVSKSLMQKNTLRRTELEHKLALHLQRAENYTLQRDSEKEVQKIHKLRQTIRMAKKREVTSQMREIDSLRVFKKMAAATQRLADQGSRNLEHVYQRRFVFPLLYTFTIS